MSGQRPLAHRRDRDDDRPVTAGEELEVVRNQLDLLDILRLLHPLDAEAERVYVTLCDREHELTAALGLPDTKERARRGDRAHSS